MAFAVFAGDVVFVVAGLFIFAVDEVAVGRGFGCNFVAVVSSSFAAEIGAVVCDVSFSKSCWRPPRCSDGATLSRSLEQHLFSFVVFWKESSNCDIV